MAFVFCFLWLIGRVSGYMDVTVGTDWYIRWKLERISYCISLSMHNTPLAVCLFRSYLNSHEQHHYVCCTITKPPSIRVPMFQPPLYPNVTYHSPHHAITCYIFKLLPCTPQNSAHTPPQIALSSRPILAFMPLKVSRGTVSTHAHIPGRTPPRT